jgi:hypothetical protein
MQETTMKALIKSLLFAAVALSMAVVPSHAQLKSLDGPKGGQIVYGPVDGADSPAAAMGSILRSLHKQYGDKPQLGRVFKVRGTNSDAVFFTLVKRNQNNMQIAGMLISAPVGPGRVEAALLSDEASRFGTSINPMLQTLFATWQPGGAPGASSDGSSKGGSGGGAEAPVERLTQFVLPDQSAPVDLAPGWHSTPQSGAGTIIAEGPNGERVLLDFPFLAMDSSNARVQQTMRFAQGAGRNTSHARALYYPYGGDPVKTFIDLNAMVRQRDGMVVPTIHIASEKQVPSNGARCAEFTGELDGHDGKGPAEIHGVFCMGRESAMGQYMNILMVSIVPEAVAERERATAAAMLASFQVNQAKVNAEASAIAAPAIARIQEIGRISAQNAANAHAREDAQRASVEKHWDSQDRNNQGFSNYLLDQTVVQDNARNEHGTVWNQTADALVKSDPNRYEYVNTPTYWKGVDY